MPSWSWGLLPSQLPYLEMSYQTSLMTSSFIWRHLLQINQYCSVTKICQTLMRCVRYTIPSFALIGCQWQCHPPKHWPEFASAWKQSSYRLNSHITFAIRNFNMLCRFSAYRFGYQDYIFHVQAYRLVLICMWSFWIRYSISNASIFTSIACSLLNLWAP